MMILSLQALRARYETCPHDEAWHLLMSGHWNEGHRVILLHIAPETIINGELPVSPWYIQKLVNLSLSTFM